VKVKEPRKITDLRWLNLFKTEWENQGQTGEWIFASRRHNPKIGTDMPEADAVLVVPIHISKDAEGLVKRKLVVCREFRIPLGDYEYGFPAGLKMPGESEKDCAARELKEETGLDFTRLILISPPIYSSTGLSDECVSMVFCECEGDISGVGREATEEMSVHLMNVHEIHDLACNFNVKQSCKLWPILLMFNLMGTLEIKP
jgi:ADP-ribose pyrophosphatase